MTVWVDADSMPAAARDCVRRRAANEAARARAAGREPRMRAVFVANRLLKDVKADGVAVKFILAPPGADAADGRILGGATPGDLAVTRDIRLAARLLEAGVAALKHLGVEFDPASIKERLSARDAMAELDAAGLLSRPASSWGARELKSFADGFDRALARLGGN